MSDSVVLYSAPIRRTSQEFDAKLSALVRISRTIIEKLLEFSLPARGALAFGQFYADTNNGIYVGRGLVEAYEEAESQEWIGAVFAPSLTDAMAAMESSFTMEKLKANSWLARAKWDYIRIDVPFKNHVQSRYVVHWATAPLAQHVLNGELLMTGAASTNLRVATKYANTINYLNACGR